MPKLYRFFSFLMLLSILLTGTADAVSYVMTYSFAGTSSIYKANLAKTGGVVNTLAPSSFDLNSDGTVTIHTLDTAFIDYLHGEGMTITPFLSNHWDNAAGIAALENIEAITDTLRDTVYSYNLDGINVDIQNVNQNYKDKYTLFVKTLRGKIPDKTVTVAVAANPKGWTTGWHGSYDYAALAANSDYLMIMAYDESYYGGDPGPVASSTFVEGSITYALKYVTADKLVLGVPFFGRYWQSGASVGGSGIVMTDVETLLKTYPDAKKIYDTASQSVRVEVTLTSSFKLWGGNTISAGTYTIWYDDLEALQYKIGLVNKYGLHGVGSWALGQENTDFWELCRTGLKNQIFSDINGHWAEDEILSCYEKGWLVGHGGKFRPGEPLTRAEAATIFVRVCELQSGTAGADFSDTKGHWARKNIAIARNYGIVSGAGNNKFLPNSYITRQEMAAMLDRILVLATGIDYNNNPFPDVSKDSWAYRSIIKLNGNGIIHGYPDGRFRPLANLSRGEMAALLERISGYGHIFSGNSLARGFDFDIEENENPVSPR